jgi:hypothetical protein
MFNDVEQTILERLRDKLPGVTVEPLRELERVPELRQKAPAVFVIYDGYTVGQSVTQTGSIQQITQEWYVVIATKSARGNGDVNSARDQAGQMTEQVLAALLGFHLGGGRYLRLSDAPGPEYDAGYVHVPLAFSNAATFKGQP